VVISLKGYEFKRYYDTNKQINNLTVKRINNNLFSDYQIPLTTHFLQVLPKIRKLFLSEELQWFRLLK
jgi:hypothetical protein